MHAAIDFKVKELGVFGDSILTIFQILEQWKTKDAKLVPYHEYLEELVKSFKKISFTYTPHMKNQFADALATLASMASITKENIIASRLRLPKARPTVRTRISSHRGTHARSLRNAAWEYTPSRGRATDAREKESPLTVYDP
ncbi:hypothetical protein CRG98_039295 [Punica granatum]|uniref:RNase H type-1 domain-containing protein n=1 Tax=Punica granatum TaxID=22663 RepID=A0A2I0I8J4_PUNGR|nr:hypothetical protein CRG98_039295 [Punica granatum]